MSMSCRACVEVFKPALYASHNTFIEYQVASNYIDTQKVPGIVSTTVTIFAIVHLFCGKMPFPVDFDEKC